MQLFYQPGISNHHCYLEPEESRHCIKVLRKKTGDLIDITDGLGNFYQVRIEHADPKKCEFSILSESHTIKREFSIHIALAPTKNIERIEWFVEKCTELGIEEISFILCRKSERKVLRIERLISKAIAAMKQSMQTRLPVINNLIAFDTLVTKIEGDTQKFIAHVDPGNTHSMSSLAKKRGSYCVLIGPEGDFTDDELAYADACNFEKISLGPNRLRTETAGVAACHELNLLNT